MINELEIHNFKSIKDLTLPCKRFNLFIGEPNTGKSNILEALGLVSFVGVRQYDPNARLDGFVRHERLSNLFYDDAADKGLSIQCDRTHLDFVCEDGRFRGHYAGPEGVIAELHADQHTVTEVHNRAGVWAPQVKFYRQPAVENFVESNCGSLLPPNGANLPSVLMQNDWLRYQSNLAFESQGLKLAFPGQANTIKLLKNYEDAIDTYPYKLASESLQRQVFYLTAIDSNAHATLLFEEPEAHSFPEAVHFLAEVIALDENNNQYFLTTHSNHFLMSHLCKAPSKDLGIHIVYSENHQTRVRTLSEEEIPQLFEFNVFLNWEKFAYPE
ncbi:MAG: AAA family ATPase [Chloroflexi bacterium]|nr:AAA family ATPase [Chloroflexota bacterium]